jgi:hypothetical protein
MATTVHGFPFKKQQKHLSLIFSIFLHIALFSPISLLCLNGDKKPDVKRLKVCRLDKGGVFWENSCVAL